jgi:uncharacterized lipoprotein
MKIITRNVLLLLALPLAGCSYFSPSNSTPSRDASYLHARSVPPLRTPPGISSSSFHNEYPVSDRQYPESALKVSMTPPGL